MKEVLVKVCSQLNKHKVEYLLIGGWAVIYHGYVRATADIDLWYKPLISNFQRIIKAFEELDVDVAELNDVIFDSKSTFLRFKISGINVELLPTLIGGPSFSEAESRSEILLLEDIEIPVIGYKDLIKIKQQTDRLKDQADIEELNKRRKKFNSGV